MDTRTVQNYQEEKSMRLKFTAGASIGTAIYILTLILIEEVTGIVLPSFWSDAYLVVGIALMVVTGSIFKAIRITLGFFKWSFLLMPFPPFDILLALVAGGTALGVMLIFPFIPMGLKALELWFDEKL